MELKEKLDQFISLTDEQRKEGVYIDQLDRWLTNYVEKYPNDITAAHMWFLFGFYFQHDKEYALEITNSCYKRTGDPISVILMASIEHNFRGGIDDQLYELLLDAHRRYEREEEVFLFFEAMYFKGKGEPYEALLKEALEINRAFPYAWLELATLHEGSPPTFNDYLDQALQGMKTGDFQYKKLFELTYYYKEVIYKSEVSGPQFDYYRSWRKK